MSLNIALDFQIAAEKYRQYPAIICNGHSVSYGVLADWMRRWAIVLSRMGVSRGDHVALVMPNVPEFTVAYFAILHLGAVVVPFNTMLTSYELRALITHSDAKLVIAHCSCCVPCAAAVRQVEQCEGLIVAGTSLPEQRQALIDQCNDCVFWMDDELAKLGDIDDEVATASISLSDITHSELTPFIERDDLQDWRSFSEDEIFQSPWPISGAEDMNAAIRSTLMAAGPATTVMMGQGGKATVSRIASDATLTGHERFENRPTWEALLSSDGRKRFAWSPAPVPTDPNDTAVILYTSGTTGTPKGAQLTHFNLYSNAMFVRECMTGYGPDKRVIAILPLYHSFGLTYTQNAALFSGATVVMVPQFEPRRILHTLAEQKVGVLAAVPTMLIHLCRVQQKLQLELPHLYQIVSGGSALASTTYEELQRMFKDVPILEAYGLSETSPLVTCRQPDHEAKMGSIGREILGSQVRIMREDHTFAEPGEIGEIVVRGHNVMKGYHKNPLATKNAFYDSWFLTGDIGRCDEDGYFFLLDRKKDVIIRAGMNIYPRDVEDTFRDHPAVNDVVVVGDAHPTHGEDVIAFVQLRQDEETGEVVSISDAELLRYCRTRLAAYKCPQKIFFVKSFPLNTTGKVLRAELKKTIL